MDCFVYSTVMFGPDVAAAGVNITRTFFYFFTDAMNKYITHILCHWPSPLRTSMIKYSPMNYNTDWYNIQHSASYSEIIAYTEKQVSIYCSTSFLAVSFSLNGYIQLENTHPPTKGWTFDRLLTSVHKPTCRLAFII